MSFVPGGNGQGTATSPGKPQSRAASILSRAPARAQSPIPVAPVEPVRPVSVMSGKTGNSKQPSFKSATDKAPSIMSRLTNKKPQQPPSVASIVSNDEFFAYPKASRFVEEVPEEEESVDGEEPVLAPPISTSNIRQEPSVRSGKNTKQPSIMSGKNAKAPSTMSRATKQAGVPAAGGVGVAAINEKAELEAAHQEQGAGSSSPDDSSDQHPNFEQDKVTAATGPATAANAVHVIQNPLKRQSKAQVYHDAMEFANTHNLGEFAELFGKAGLVARDSNNFQSISELNPDEQDALAYERAHKWHSSKMLWYSISLCAIGAATQGWDQTGSNGANLSFPHEFGIDGKGRDEWIVGAINSVIFLTAGCIGAFIVDPLNHYLGRRGEIFLTAMCLTATPIASGFTHSWQALFAVRFVLGIGIGAKNATVPIFSAELAPARIRGALVMFWQLWVVAGIFLGFCSNVIFKDVPRIAWRLQLGSAFLPAFILMCGIWFTPESPRWLMKHGHYDKAFRSFLRLRAHPIISARDYYYSYVIYEEEQRVAGGGTYWSRMRDCFTIPRIRRANYGASTVMLAQQMCGINIISFYSSTIFTDVGYSDTQALYASLGYGAVQVVFTIPTLFLIDTAGRRKLCLITFPLMCIFLLAAGLSVLKTDGSPASRIGPVVLFVYLFTICYSLGEGPVAFQYSAEVFPTIQREQGMAWAVFINNFFAGVLSLTFPRMRTVMTTTGAFGFYAGLNLIAWVMIFCFVRETKQLTLEELDQVFSVPTAQFVGHETRVWLPWFFKRYFLFQRNLPKPPSIIATADEDYGYDKGKA